MRASQARLNEEIKTSAGPVYTLTPSARFGVEMLYKATRKSRTSEYNHLILNDFNSWLTICIRGLRAFENNLRDFYMKILTSALLALALTSFASIAQALPIVGSFGFTGEFAPLGGTSSDTATGIDFTDPTGRIGTCSGDYTSIFTACSSVTGDVVTLKDIPIGTLPNSGGVAYSDTSWISTATLVFDLTSITDILRDSAGLTSLRITGLGVAKAAGFSDTLGSFILTFNGSGVGQFTFSSSVTTPVSEPGTFGLLGLGLLALGLIRRRTA